MSHPFLGIIASVLRVALVVVTSLGAVFGQCDTVHDVLGASDASSSDFYGGSVSISGDVAVFGATGVGDFPPNGAVYVSRYDGGSWIEEQILTASDSVSQSLRFGEAVSVSGDVIFVGAEGSDELGGNSGCVYVFRYDGSSWIEEQKLSASDASPGANFGVSVAVQGAIGCIGAWGDSEAGGAAGAAYVFRFDGSEWVEEQKLIASEVESDDSFGNSVSIDGDVAVIGAAGHVFVGHYNPGAAYVYRFTEGVWVEEQRLTASPEMNYDQFGYAVALDGDSLIIGTGYGGENRAYMFSFDGASWNELQELTPPGGLGWHNSVAIRSGLAVIGNPGAMISGFETGNTHVYRFDGVSWQYDEEFRLENPAMFDGFGSSVAVEGDQVMVGAPGTSGTGTNSGSVHEYELCREGFLRGDANQSSFVDLGDAIYVLNYLYVGGATPPNCLDSSDANDDGVLDIADSVCLLTFLFGGSLSIPFPYPDCGTDPTDDGLAPGNCDMSCP